MNSICSPLLLYHFICYCYQLYTVYAEIFAVWNFRWTRKQTGFSLLYFCGSQVHRGKVACYVLLQISNCCKLANFHGLNFCCISRWPRNLHSAISAHTVYISVPILQSYNIPYSRKVWWIWLIIHGYQTKTIQARSYLQLITFG